MRAPRLVHDLHRTSDGRFLARRFARLHAIVSENLVGKGLIRSLARMTVPLIAVGSRNTGKVSLGSTSQCGIVRYTALVASGVGWPVRMVPAFLRFVRNGQSLSCSVDKQPMIGGLREEVSGRDRIARSDLQIVPKAGGWHVGKRARWLRKALPKDLVERFINESATFILGPASRKVQRRKIRKIFGRRPGEFIQ